MNDHTPISGSVPARPVSDYENDLHDGLPLCADATLPRMHTRTTTQTAPAVWTMQ